MLVFELAAVAQIGGEAGGSKRVATNIPIEPGILRAPADHAMDIDAVHRVPASIAPIRASRLPMGDASETTARATEAPYPNKPIS